MSEPRSHDPLCLYFPDDSTERICTRCYEHDCECCQCDLIAKVRADERGQAANRMKGFIFRNFRHAGGLTAMEAAMHAINATPNEDLPKWLQQ